MDTLEYHTTDHKGREYRDFFPCRSPSQGPGWYVYGRNPDWYSGLVHLCGRPAVAARKHPHYNGKVRRGFRTKREAQHWADQMNREQKA